MLKVILIAATACFYLSCANGERNYLINITSFNCNVNYTAVESMDCHLGRIGMKGVMSAHLVLRRPINDFTLRVIIDIHKAKGPSFRMLDFETDGCAFFHVIHNKKLFNIVTKTIKRFARELPGCPMKVNFNYTLTNALLTEEEFPSYLPEGMVTTFIKVTSEGYPNQIGILRGTGQIKYLSKLLKANGNGNRN